MPPDLSDDEIITILDEEYQRLHNVSPPNRDEAKKLAQMRDAVQVMKIRHAQNLAEARGNNEILAELRTQITWAELQLAGANENPYLTTDSPSVLAQQILESK
jgi:hydroxymethylpyrimidine/phosphomethylpyrimidine kinase